MYHVKTFIIETSFFTNTVKATELDKKLEKELNSIAKDGYQIVSVVQLNTAGSDFKYQIIYKDPEALVISGDSKSEIIVKEKEPKEAKKEEVKEEEVPAKEEFIPDEVIDTSLEAITEEDLDYDAEVKVDDEVVLLDDYRHDDILIKKHSIGVVMQEALSFGGRTFIVFFDGIEANLKARDVAVLKRKNKVS